MQISNSNGNDLSEKFTFKLAVQSKRYANAFEFAPVSYVSCSGFYSKSSAIKTPKGKNTGFDSSNGKNQKSKLKNDFDSSSPEDGRATE
jgi:hypothetical protein